ncbi:S41 family peptidase [Luteolibacter pohnpeiensis]|uniref:S41 family peptidase n=1 Tax=Luteolibacter pohnpeiensis TaxID=454153 RepID=A0A934S8P0_9BACT|nr:S41 family peptidase [Luteolibacter pohnpeiensis]MBK1881727.1 S41 family peptidase [Luteolibacter pohnpeiensis]
MKFSPSVLKHACSVALAISFASTSIYADTVSESDTHEIIANLTDRLVDAYPFPEISAKYQAGLLENEKAGKYKDLSDQDLAKQLTEDLRTIHKDVHLNVIFRKPAPDQNGDDQGRQRRPRGNNGRGQGRARSNFGFNSVDLDSQKSTAYLDIPGPFMASDEAFEAAGAAMTLSAHSKYVILDIRHNPGGTGQMGRFIASYFFQTGQEQFYLNGFHKDRSMDDQEWTYSYVPGRRNPDAKVYILIGPGTGSASEGFAYAMQKMGRATIVGKPSAGAGIAGSFIPLKNGSGFSAFIPVKMVVGPRTLEGWEGTGVIPDVDSGDKNALDVARELIDEDLKKN